jgi:hypothetical protein
MSSAENRALLCGKGTSNFFRRMASGSNNLDYWGKKKDKSVKTVESSGIYHGLRATVRLTVLICCTLLPAVLHTRRRS